MLDNEKKIYHTEYENNIKNWKRYADCYAGEQAIKQHDIDLVNSKSGFNDICDFYLPPTTGMLIDNNFNLLYSNYLNYANFYGATGRTVEGYLGLVFRKSPVIAFPEKFKEYLKTIGYGEKNLNHVVFNAVKQVIIKNRIGIMIDAPKIIEDVQLTVKQIEDSNITPYIITFEPEKIINWEYIKEGNKEELVLVVIDESHVEKLFNSDNPIEFENEEITQYRVLLLKEGLYYQQIYVMEKVDGKDKLTLKEEIQPTIGGKPIDYIPFWFITKEGFSEKIEPSLIEDLVNTNIALYRNSANYENALLLTANPTPCVSGLRRSQGNKEDRLIKIGSSTVLEFSVDGKWGFLEYQGQGVNSIKEAMVEKKQELATLGARNLEVEKKGVESAKTVQIHRSADVSVLGALAQNVSVSITEILKVYNTWLGAENKDVSYQLNIDFDIQRLPSSDIQVLGNQVVQGLVSWETYFYNLQKGEIIPENVTNEEELDRIALDQERKLEKQSNNMLDDDDDDDDND